MVGPDGGVADQNVDFAQGFQGVGHQFSALVAVGNVGSCRVGLNPQLTAFGCHFLQFLRALQ